MVDIGGYFGINDRYTITKELGSGGMGTVYLAYDNMLKEDVAIKCLNKEYVSDTVVRNRFLNEAKICLNLTHPNIIRVRDVNVFDDIYYMVMEYINGVELKYYFENDDKKDIEAIYKLIEPVLESLAYAHNFTIHRDIKPSNIMIKDNKPYLMDFGISKALDNSELTNHTQIGGMGTKKYVSPEQTFNANDVDKRADIYSMGVLLYELFTGVLPKNTAVVKPENPSIFNANISPFLDRVLLKMIEPKANDRYGDFTEVLRAFNEIVFTQQIVDIIEETTQENHINSETSDLTNMVLIKGGNYLRGGGLESNNPIEKPRKSIYVDDFYMAKYCVTNEEYNEFIQATQYNKPKGFDEILKQKPNHPVVNVSFKDAIEYCKYKGVTLPTEAQWEKAAKGGKNNIYPWGNEYDPNLLNIEFNVSDTVSVDGFEDGRSFDGIYNMAGNVWEWCLDDFVSDYYSSDETDNPCASENGVVKVLRGGSFDFVQNGAKCSFRFHEKSNTCANNIGFRVVSRVV